ncbi:GLPGLI family protein [uncultured Aquimarina sp.]|uniref:GLPGLI family protein n=1 Tax=uncultured Aquimarina sp. TaxID=575652 RepID=UPI00260F01F8|nr:GLPGLI family protein [uncultured Aquimarina sp.]
MKNLIKFLLFIAITQVYSQTSINGTVSYQQTITNQDQKKDKEYTLFFNRGVSYYEEQVDNELKKEQVKESDGTITLKTRDNKNPQFYYNNLNDGFYFSEIYYNKHLFVKDDIQLNWQILSETKEISGYQCQKATANFRGRNYIVWFTNKIPTPFGPWKLYGLSGLILEASDQAGFISIKAKKITIKTTSKTENSMPQVKTNKAITVSDFLKEKQELQDIFIAKINSKLPKGVKPFKIDNACSDCGKELEVYD